MNRQNFLESEIIRHKSLYYQGTPEITDTEYDALEEELRDLDKDSFALKIVGSIESGSNKVAHKTKMLSLDKKYTLEELLKWKGEEPLVIHLAFSVISSP